MTQKFTLYRSRHRVTRHSSESAETLRQLSDVSCIVEGIVATNDTGTDGWVMIFDSEEEPDNGDLPVIRFPITGDGSVGFDVFIPIQTKGWVAISTSRGVLTKSSDGAYFYVNVSLK